MPYFTRRETWVIWLVLSAFVVGNIVWYLRRTEAAARIEGAAAHTPSTVQTEP